MDQGDAVNEGPEEPKALNLLNTALAREVYEAFYAPDKQCYLKHIATNTVAIASPNPHRPFSQQEVTRRDALASYLTHSSEDELIEQVLLPLFRQLGFHRVTASGHKDKALEYGKDNVGTCPQSDNGRTRNFGLSYWFTFLSTQAR